MPSDEQARRRRDAATDDEALLADDAAGQDDDDTEALARLDGLDTTTTLDSAEGDAPVSAAAVEGGMMADLETARLTITPFTPALAGGALTGRARLGQALGVRVPDDWLEDDCEEILPLIAATVRDGSLGGADAHRGGELSGTARRDRHGGDWLRPGPRLPGPRLCDRGGRRGRGLGAAAIRRGAGRGLLPTRQPGVATGAGEAGPAAGRHGWGPAGVGAPAV
jgi:hypothetical protein